MMRVAADDGEAGFARNGVTNAERQTPNTERLLDIYRRLCNRFGAQSWWPGETPFEVVVGAILTQRAAWVNVEQAIGNLERAGALAPEAIAALPVERLAELIRPSGYFNQKAQRLKAVAAYLMERCGGELEKLKGIPTGALRGELLSIKGVGPETADSILLYALERPVFVIDAYTRRVLNRIGLVEEGADYRKLQALFQDNLPGDTALFNDYHAQFVALGKNYCRQKPLCEECPLKEVCLAR